MTIAIAPELLTPRAEDDDRRPDEGGDGFGRRGYCSDAAGAGC